MVYRVWQRQRLTRRLEEKTCQQRKETGIPYTFRIRYLGDNHFATIACPATKRKRQRHKHKNHNNKQTKNDWRKNWVLSFSCLSFFNSFSPLKVYSFFFLRDGFVQRKLFRAGKLIVLYYPRNNLEEKVSTCLSESREPNLEFIVSSIISSKKKVPHTHFGLTFILDM